MTRLLVLREMNYNKREINWVTRKIRSDRWCYGGVAVVGSFGGDISHAQYTRWLVLCAMQDNWFCTHYARWIVSCILLLTLGLRHPLPLIKWSNLKTLTETCWILDTFEWNKHRCTYVHSRIYSYVVESGVHSSTCCTSGWWSLEWTDDIWNLHWFIYILSE